MASDDSNGVYCLAVLLNKTVGELTNIHKMWRVHYSGFSLNVSFRGAPWTSLYRLFSGLCLLDVFEWWPRHLFWCPSILLLFVESYIFVRPRYLNVYMHVFYVCMHKECTCIKSDREICRQTRMYMVWYVNWSLY